MSFVEGKLPQFRVGNKQKNFQKVRAAHKFVLHVQL